MALTVRLNPKTERSLAALAKRKGLSRSEVVREAIAHYGAVEDAAEPGRPYDAWLDVIGIVDVGARDATHTTGEQFTTVLRERARARRAR